MLPNYGWYKYQVSSSNEPEEATSSSQLTGKWTIQAMVRDEMDRLVVLREPLYEDPQLFHKYIPGRKPHKETEDIPTIDSTSSPDCVIIDPLYPSGYDWTQQQWQKAGNFQSSATTTTCKAPQNKKGKKNKFIKDMMTVLSQPVKMSKAESMMQKMGWQGGALGKTGNGIVEPIAPDVTYVTHTTLGFGQEPEPPKKPKSKNKLPTKQPKLAGNARKQKRPNFNMNVLLHILDFVKNDAEVELAFEAKLPGNERKYIHIWVNDVINGDDGEATSEEWDVVKEIREHNNLLLTTESEGEKSDRKLIIYKEAPEYVYLITPDYLKDEDSALNKQIAAFESNLNLNENKVGSRMLNNGTATNKNVPGNTMSSVHSKLIEYLKEFANDDVYNELRFIGMYNRIELDAINEFWTNVYKYMNWDTETIDKRYLQVFPETNLYFTVEMDCNGYNVIHKYLMDTP